MQNRMCVVTGIIYNDIFLSYIFEFFYRVYIRKEINKYFEKLFIVSYKLSQM